ncbi:MAG: IS630 family transposase [Nostoc sp. DedVER02]|uniref:IS630 family transposase n=1 Tax=unclassified Nostoc TaxID=2593658 RepID=UPI00391AB039
MLNSLEKHLALGKCVHYLCQDETRLGLKTLTGKVITACGVKPTVPVKWERENFWIYGAIEPFTGQHFQQEYPKLNGDYFQQFLDWLSQQLGEDYAILQIDQAPAHISGAINWPENIIPLLQPPHSPELNPIERLWQFLKKPLKNELFSSLQDLRNRVQQLFEQLTFDEVISISSYNFILEALFYAASY